MSRIRRNRATQGFAWPETPFQRYDGGQADKATKQILIGWDEGEPSFNLRYFRVEPGGHTALDQHAHDHGVVVLHGEAILLLGNEETIVRPGDVIYISPNEVHQFTTHGTEPFGFLCIVPPRPKPVEPPREEANACV